MAARRLELSVLPERFAVCRLEISSPLPAWLPNKGFVCVTRLPMPAFARGSASEASTPTSENSTGPWISTFDTDYLLVAQENLDRTVAALTSAGHTIERAV